MVKPFVFKFESWLGGMVQHDLTSKCINSELPTDREVATLLRAL